MSTQIELESNQLSNGHTNDTFQCQIQDFDLNGMHDFAMDEFSNACDDIPFFEEFLNTLNELISQDDNPLKRSRSNDEDDNPLKRSRSNDEDEYLDLRNLNAQDVNQRQSVPFDDEEIESTGGLFGYDGTFCPSLKSIESDPRFN